MPATVAAFIQARLGSTRLPAKVSLDLQGRPVLEHVIRRARAAHSVQETIVVTTLDRRDLDIVAMCARLGVRVFCGSEDDVLDRFYQAAKLIRPDHVVRLTADCPLIDPAVIDRVIAQHLASPCDYTANVIEETFPDGEDVEIISYGALERSWREATLTSEREHVTPYVRNHPELFTASNVRNKTDLAAKRWTLDNPEDYEFLRAVFQRLYPRDPLFGMDQVVTLLEEHPELELINSAIPRNEGYAKSLREDTIVEDNTNNPGPGTGQRLYRAAKSLMPGGTQLLSKRPEQFLPDLWPAYYREAKGCEIWDLDGNKFIDMSYMGIGANILGYADEDVDRAVVEAIKRGNMSTLNVPEEVELARLLIELHPWAEMVRYARTGGEAMAVAVRIARASTRKDIVLFCGYHGWSDWYLAANLADDRALDGQLLPGLKPSGVPHALTGTALPFSYNDVDQFRQLVHEYGDRVGAVVVEAVRNVMPDLGFLEALRGETKRLDVPLVVDEVSSGWRLNVGGAHLVLGLEPDIAVFAKGMGNGYPMAAVIGKSRFMDAAQESFISSTYWTDLIGPTAALATIRKMRERETPKQLIESGRAVQSLWTELAGKHGLSVQVSGIPPLSHLEFDTDKPLVMKTLFTQLMLERGFLATNGYYASYAHKPGHISAYAEAVEESFAIMARARHSGDVESLLAGPVCHSGFRRLT